MVSETGPNCARFDVRNKISKRAGWCWLYDSQTDYLENVGSSSWLCWQKLSVAMAILIWRRICAWRVVRVPRHRALHQHQHHIWQTAQLHPLLLRTLLGRPHHHCLHPCSLTALHHPAGTIGILRFILSSSSVLGCWHGGPRVVVIATTTCLCSNSDT